MTKNYIALAICICIAVLSVGKLTASPALPPLESHPLPPTLAQWQDSTNSGDYFSEVKATDAGYLVWSEFPIAIYIERGETESNNADRSQKWVESVLRSVREWSVYLPLEVVDRATDADIAIWRSRPSLNPSYNPSTGRFDLPRIRSAETRYEFYIRKSSSTSATLSHRFNIKISPNQAPDYILPSARHELGHALGIWGHSRLETDALYFSQVRNSPPISARDINTLKKIYQQPTRLGWPLSNTDGLQ